jgi:hypothetical protein
MGKTKNISLRSISEWAGGDVVEAETLIRQRMEDLAKAIRARDIDAVISLYAPNIVSFDLGQPLRYAGAARQRRAWLEVFAASSGPIRSHWLRDSRLECHDPGRPGLRSQRSPRERHAAWRSHRRPLGALDGMFPENR